MWSQKRQCNNSPVHSDTFRKAAMGNAHAALQSEVEYWNSPSILCYFQCPVPKNSTSHLVCTWRQFNRRESPHALRAWHSSGLKNYTNWSMKLVFLLSMLWTHQGAVDGHGHLLPHLLNKKGSNLVLPFWKGVLNWEIFMHTPLSFHLAETEPTTHSA